MRSLEDRVSGPLRRDEGWFRRLRVDEPRTDWARFCARIPPEMAELLDARLRLPDGPRSRDAIVLAALRVYLEATEPESESDVETVAVDVQPLIRARLGIDDPR